MDQPTTKTIFVIGAYGFIGSALVANLVATGHQVIGFGRNIEYAKSIFPDIQWIKGDLADYTDDSAWQPLLENIDIVINASGVLQSGPSDTVNVTQSDAIIALIDACTSGSVNQFIQISACGATVEATNDFMKSKAVADNHLLQSNLHATILRPGLVIGRNSYGGTEFIRMVSATPGISPILSGFGTVQIIALADVVEAVSKTVRFPEKYTDSYDLVDEQPHSLSNIIAQHRQGLGFGPARLTFPIGKITLKLTAIVSDTLGWLGWRSPMRSNAISALIAGVRGEATQTLAILDRPAFSLEQTLKHYHFGKQDRIHARLMAALPIFLMMLVLLWLGSGILGFLKSTEAAALLNNTGLPPGVSLALVVGGAAADIIIGIGLMLRKTVRVALVGTIMMTGAYLIGSMILTPALWLDPLAPMIKALAAMGLSFTCLIALDKR